MLGRNPIIGNINELLNIIFVLILLFTVCGSFMGSRFLDPEAVRSPFTHSLT